MSLLQKNIFGILVLVISFVNTSKAQFKSATIGIDGLTCSACTNATEQSIKLNTDKI